MAAHTRTAELAIRGALNQLADSTTLEECRRHNNVALRSAAAHNQVDVLDWLLARGITLEDCRAENNEALRCAAMNGHVQVLEWLHARGLTPADYRSVLRQHNTYAHVEVLDWLQAHGTTLEDYKANSNLALHGALSSGNTKGLKWLYARGITPESLISSGVPLSVVRIAAEHNHVEVLDWLFEIGVTPETHYEAYVQSLYWAAARNQVAAIDWLMTHGMNLYHCRRAQCQIGAAVSGSTAVLDQLEALGMTLDDYRSNANRALRLAAEGGHVAVLNWLLARGITLEECRSIVTRGCHRPITLEWMFARGATLAQFTTGGHEALWRKLFRERQLAAIVGQRSRKPRLPAELWEMIDS